MTTETQSLQDSMRVAFYAREMVEHTVDRQLEELRAVAPCASWCCVGEWVDRGSAGAKAGTHQPQLAALLQAAAQRRFDMVAVWSLDSLGGSIHGVIDVLHRLRTQGIEVYLHQQRLHTQARDGRALFDAVGLLAEFERRRRSERVRVGLERIDRSGHVKAQPPRRRIDAAMEARILELRRQGLGILSVARQAGCGVSSVQRVLAAHAD